MGIREVSVKFQNGRVVNVGDYQFYTYNPRIKQNAATRQHIPLRLAYVLTVHRAQGLTPQRAVVHCTGMQRPGMLAVACSRVRDSRDLNTIGFAPELHYMSHSTDVERIYESKTLQYTAQCSKPKPFTGNNPSNVNLEQLLIGIDWEDEVPFTNISGISIAADKSDSDSDVEPTSKPKVIPITLSTVPA